MGGDKATTTTTGLQLFGQESSTTPKEAATERKSDSATKEGAPVPLEYQNKTVQEIINSFSENLEKDAVEFVKQAQRVAEWDAVLRESQVGMEELTEKVSQLFFQQQEVDRTLNAVCSYQKEINTTLDGLEVNLGFYSSRSLVVCFCINF